MTPADETAERHQRHEQELQRLQNVTGDLAIMIGRLDEKMSGVQISLGDILEALRRGYVTIAEFEPVKRVVYGLVTLVLTAVVGALLALVVTGKIKL